MDVRGRDGRRGKAHQSAFSLKGNDILGQELRTTRRRRKAGAMPLWTSLLTGLTFSMKKHGVTVSEIGVRAAARAMLGAGVAQLLIDRHSPPQRRPVGCSRRPGVFPKPFPPALEVFRL